MAVIERSIVVDASRERVYAYLCDLANHEAFSDHFLKDFRVGRVDSAGVGASARFRIAYPLGGSWGEWVVAEADPPHVVRLEGRMGRLGRVAMESTYVLTGAGQAMTRIEQRLRTEPVHVADRLRETLGFGAWLRRNAGRSLRRMADQLERAGSPQRRVSVASG